MTELVHCRDTGTTLAIQVNSSDGRATGTRRPIRVLYDIAAMVSQVTTLLCIATYRKGDEFLRECKRQGCRVLLLTDETLRDADWPRDAIDAFYYTRRDMPPADIRKGAAFLARTERLDRIVALDDFDVETAAMLREYLHVPGMGETTGRAFRDKLAMRARARAAAIPVPEFVHVVNHDAINEWTARVSPPWVLKPRSQAAAIGIKKVGSAGELWTILDALGDGRPDTCWSSSCPATCTTWIRSCSIGGSCSPRPAVTAPRRWRSRTREGSSSPAHSRTPIRSRRGSSRSTHGCWILSACCAECRTRSSSAAHDGELYFLETSARVGGAYIVDVVEAATGLNLWREWAKIEIAASTAPTPRPRRWPLRGDRVVARAAGAPGHEQLQRSGNRPARGEAPSRGADCVVR